MKKCLALSSVLVLFAILSGCSGNGSSGSNAGKSDQAAPPYVDWSSIPSNFNPQVEDMSFRTDGAEKINVDIFGFDKDVKVIYSSKLAANEGQIRKFRIWAKSASFGDLKSQSSGKSVELKEYGRYQCSIRVQNGKVTALEGGCYVRVEIILPLGAEIEVYNVEQLISRRFIPIDNETFLKNLDHATWEKDKFAAIENFLASYTGTSKSPSLTCHDLGLVLDKFIRGEDKLTSLRKLQSVISDRQNLGTMIDDKVNYFDRAEARRIVGI